VKVPLIAAGVAGAVVAAAVGVAELLAAEFPLAGVFVAPAFLVATGLPAVVAAAVALVVAEDDDEADALAVVSAPAIGAPAMLIALVDPN
jgi:copper(I)-binding protein